MGATRGTRTEQDGRRMRRRRGRTRVVDAMLDLILETGALPDVDTLSDRAGVSAATIYRYFEGLDDLRVATFARTRERYAALFVAPPVGSGDLDDRVAGLVGARADRYETIGPVAALVRARAVEHRSLRTVLEQSRREQLDQARAHFAPELDVLSPARAEDVAVSVVAATSFEAWDIQVGLGRTPTQVRRAWTLAVHRLVAPTS